MGEDIGPHFLDAGVDFGRTCLPSDVRSLPVLASNAGVDPSVLNSVLGINATLRSCLWDKPVAHLVTLAGKRIAILGLPFELDTDDVSESPAIDVIRKLQAAGATVSASDPAAEKRVVFELPDIVISQDPFAAAMGADAVVLLTVGAANGVIDLDHLANAMRGQLLVDARSILDPEEVSKAGLVYAGVGRRGTHPWPLPATHMPPVQSIAAD